MAPIRFFRRSEGRTNQKRNSGRKVLQRTKKSRLGFETLESRWLLSAVTTFDFVIPAEVAAKGVYAAVYSNKAGYYVSCSDSPVKPTSTWTDESIGAAGATLPLITLAEAGTYPDAVTVSLVIPDTYDLPSAEMFFFVGTTTVTITQGQVNAPTVAVPDEATTIANYGMIEFNYTAASGLDVDSSLVNSIAVPFTIVYPEDANLPYPLTTLGVTLNETELNADFVAAFSDGGEYEDYSEFLQCATYAQEQDSSNPQVASPGSILAAEADLPATPAVKANADTNSTLVDGCTYYYCITAFSDNVIAGSDGVVGETLLSNYVPCQIVGQQSVEVSWTKYYDPNVAGYNVYRYASSDGSLPSDTTVYNLIAHLYGADKLSHTDQGAIPQAKENSATTAINYGFSKLSEYYTSEIKKFFGNYTEPNSFAIHINGVLWLGNTVQYTPTASWNATGETYTVLRLTAQNTEAGISVYEGDTVYVYQPIFSKNTSYVDDDAPVMPSWLSANFSEYESPAQMVFNCDGVFATNDYDPDLVGRPLGDGTALASIENAICAALNRGVATDAGIQPDNWAAAPLISNAPVVSPGTGTGTATTYYYAVTAVNEYGETTPSMVVSATVHANENVTLTWSAGANAQTALSYKVYRGLSANNLTLLDTVTYFDATTYTDVNAASKADGATPIPHQYFTVGTKANWYAAFIQSDSVTNAVSGVSLHGLSYGFPYSDQGGLSTNIGFGPDDIPASITVNIGSLNGPSFVTQSLTDAVAGDSYSQTLVLGGDSAGTTVSSSDLPSWLSLDTSTGSPILTSTNVTGTAGNTYTFNIVAAKDGNSTTMQFSLNVIAEQPVTPLTIAGATAISATGPTDPSERLQLASVDANTSSFTTYIQATGGDGTGNYTITLLENLPSGLSFTGFSSSGDYLTSADGLFELAGGATAASGLVGFNVKIEQGDATLYAVVYILMCDDLQFTTATLDDAIAGNYYYTTLATNNSSSTVTYACASLPSGLHLTPWGVLYGTVTEGGSFTVTATDGAGGHVSHSFTLSLAASPAPISIAAEALPTATPGEAYSQTVATVTGGVGALNYAVISGSIPAGLALAWSGDQLVLSGTIAASAPGGRWAFSLMVTDCAGQSASEDYEVNVYGVTTNTHSLSNNATSLVINGFFDDGVTSVTLSSGTVTGFTRDSATQITVSVTEGTLGVGALTATVTMTAGAFSSQVAAVIDNFAPPTITAKTHELDANTTTLVIRGNNFDSNAATGTNVVWLSSGTVLSATVDSAAQITVLISGPLDAGALYAKVTTDGIASNTAQVGTVLSADSPTLDTGANQLFNDVTSVSLYGVGFQAADVTNVAVVLNDGNTTTFTSGAVTVVSNYELTVAGVDFGSFTGDAYAIVTITKSGVDLVSISTQFATLVGSSTAVTIMPSSANYSKSETGTSLVVNGSGFSASTSLILYGLEPGVGWIEIADYTATCDSPNQYTFTINSDLTSYSVLGVHIGPMSVSSAPTQVAALEADTPAPSITETTTDISGHVTTVSIQGSFDVNGSNYVTLYSKTDEGDYVALPVGAIASTASQMGVQDVTVTANELTVTLAGILPVGNLYASVITDGVSTSTTEPVQIANVSTLGPIVTPTTPSRSQTPTVLTIEGQYFNTNGLNTVTLYSGESGETQLPLNAVASVAVQSSSLLIITLNDSVVLPAGKLWATVTIHGCSSGSPVQIATIVASGPTVDFCSINLSPGVATMQIQGANLSAVNSVTLSTFSTALDAVESFSVNAAGTLLTVTLKSGVLSTPTAPYQLYATLASSDAESDAVQVFRVTGTSTLTITESHAKISIYATQLIIKGTDFDTDKGATTTVQLSSGYVASVSVTSSTEMVVTLSPTVSPMDVGAIFAVVTVNGVSTSRTQVATGFKAGLSSSTIGLYNNVNATFYLRDSNSSGQANTTFVFGSAGNNWIAIVGDWDGDGVDTVGLYDQSAGKFYLRNSNSSGQADNAFVYGPAGDDWMPIVGDWNGDGVDTIGLYDQSAGKFYLRNSNSPGQADVAFVFGPSGSNWIPVAGDWNADGKSTTGLYSQTGGKFYLRYSNSSGQADNAFLFGPAGNDWTAIAGDWNSDGSDSIGLYASSNAKVYLRNEKSSGPADNAFSYGPSNNLWTPLAGNWSDTDTISNTLTTAETGNIVASSETSALTQSNLDKITREAISRLKDSGISSAALAKIEAAQVVIAALTGTKVAVIENNVIHLDTDAAGRGWFVDSTPSLDEEYIAKGIGVAMQARSSTGAVDRIDLLTVVEQELSKLAGLDDLVDCVVGGQIRAGVRTSLV